MKIDSDSLIESSTNRIDREPKEGDALRDPTLNPGDLHPSPPTINHVPEQEISTSLTEE